MFDLSPLHLVLMSIVAFNVGFTKTGLPGAGILSVPLIAMVMPGQQSVGALLIMLIFGDMFGMYYYCRHVDWKRFLQLLPWALIGVLIGYFGLMFIKTDATMNRFIGITVVVLLLVNWIRKARPEIDKKIPRNWIFAIPFGLLAGALTMMANGAGPVMMLYLLVMDFDKDKFMGTGAAYFVVVNLFKVPFHIQLGNITWSSLAFSATWFPIIFIGAIAGRWMFKKFRQEVFIVIIQVLTAVAAVKLLLTFDKAPEIQLDPNGSKADAVLIREDPA